MHNNVTVIILAGGNGSRLGTIGQIVPKPLMPIYDSILIEENLRYTTSHFEQVIVSTRPELFDIFKKYLETISTTTNWANKIKLIPNPGHQKSSLDALLFLQKELKTKYFLLMFSDIYFYSDPFVNLPTEISSNILGLTEITRKYEKKIGLAKVENNKVISLRYSDVKNEDNYSEWNGITIMQTHYLTSLEKFLNSKTIAVPEEEFIDNLISNNITFESISTPQFINANTNEDLFTISQIRRNALFNLNGQK